jgi:UTP--glucose-1-phosphate uridylyltransferase
MSGNVRERVSERIRGLPAPVREIAARHRFDEAGFLERVERWARGGMDADGARVAGALAPCPDTLIERMPEPGTAEAVEAAAAGNGAIRAGKVGALVLNGGMATRFGGVVKGVVEALPGRSFLAIKLEQVAALPGRVPAFLMTSFATRAATERHLEAIRPADPVHLFDQSVSLRLAPDGDLLDVPGDPNAVLHAPGHGDTLAAFRESGMLDRFRRAGGEWLLVSNVDNVGARIDPVVVGRGIASGRRAGDTGGMPALLDGRPQIVEAFRMPPAFDDSPIRWFNTNTFLLHASLFDGDAPLTWFAVHKKVNGLPAIQFERLLGEITATVEPLFLGVPRQGPRSRFLPVKEPADLERLASAIADAVGTG